MNVILVCDQSFDGMMSAVYEGWIRMNRGDSIHIHPGEVYDYNFLYQYEYINTDRDRALRVATSIRRKISLDAYTMVFRSCMHYDEDRVDCVIAFLKQGYKKGADITKDLGNPVVMRLYELSRKVYREAHLYKGFVRFKEIKNNILYSKIEPKCDVLPLIAHHFTERYPLENWMIYDQKRKKVLVHPKGKECIMVSDNDTLNMPDMADAKDEYEDLWCVFFQSIGIKERKNEKCQDNLMPKWFRDNMTEFRA